MLPRIKFWPRALTLPAARPKIRASKHDLLPIVERELRVAARRRGTYSMRLALACGALVTSAVIYVVNAAVGTTDRSVCVQGLGLALPALLPVQSRTVDGRAA